MLREKRAYEESQWSNIPIERSYSFPEISSTVDNFHLFFEHPLSKSCISEGIVDESTFNPYIPLPKTEFGRNILQVFIKTKGLVSKVQHTAKKAILLQKIVHSPTATPTTIFVHTSVVSSFVVPESLSFSASPIFSTILASSMITTTQ